MKITVDLELERETKNTYRYSTERADAAISPLYINKSAFDGEAPKRIRVTVEDA